MEKAGICSTKARLLGGLPRAICAWLAAAIIALACSANSHAENAAFTQTIYPMAGFTPQESPIADSMGTVFGTTSLGGPPAAKLCHNLYFESNGCGTIFMMKTVPQARGSVVIHTFPSLAEGFEPRGLALDGQGGLYGLTFFGGTVTSFCRHGCGTIFHMTPPTPPQTAWGYTVLYRFRGGRDAQYPVSSPAVDKSGALYGVSGSGGGHNTCHFQFPSSCGSVFRLAPKNAAKTEWTETILHGFTGGADGGAPFGTLTIDPATGTIYGATSYGGTGGSCGQAGCGTIFALTPSSGGKWTFETLYSFTGGTDGYSPNGALLLRDGDLYGTAGSGGKPGLCGSYGCGTVFRLSRPAKPNDPWTLRLLYSFNGKDGRVPFSGVTASKSGVLYGTASEGGGVGGPICNANGGCGLVYRLKPPASGSGAWTYESLYRFHGTDGLDPDAGVTLVGDSVFGMTDFGGRSSSNCNSQGCGVLFGLSP